MTRLAPVVAFVLLVGAAPGYGAPVVFSNGTFVDAEGLGALLTDVSSCVAALPAP